MVEQNSNQAYSIVGIVLALKHYLLSLSIAEVSGKDQLVWEDFLALEQENNVVNISFH